MLEIVKKKDMNIVFNKINELKQDFIYFVFALIGIGYFIYFYRRIPPYSIIKIELLILFFYLMLGICTEKKIIIYLNRTEMIVYESFYYKKNRKEILSLKYSEIKKLNRVYIGTRASWYSLEVITTNQKNITIINKTSLKEDLQKIIELYEEYQKEIIE